MNAPLTVGAHAFGAGVRVTEFVSDVAVVWLLIETARRGTIADFSGCTPEAGGRATMKGRGQWRPGMVEAGGSDGGVHGCHLGHLGMEGSPSTFSEEVRS